MEIPGVTSSQLAYFLDTFRNGSAERACAALGADPPIYHLFHLLADSGFDEAKGTALFRELLKVHPCHPDWDRLEAEGGPSLESLLLSVSDLRWDLREREEAELLAAIRSRPDRAGIEFSGGLRFGLHLPATFGLGRGLELVRDSVLSTWQPIRLDLESLRLRDCAGPLTLGAAVAPADPAEVSGLNILEVDPDLAVLSSAPSLAFRSVQRTFRGGWSATYFLPVGCQGWTREVLDPAGMDLAMPVTYEYLPADLGLRPPPLGSVTVLRYGPLAQLPEGWEVEGVLELYGLENLETLPEGLRLRPALLSERCDLVWSRFPDHSLLVSNCPRFRSLPELLEVPWGLSLEDLPNLHQLPANLCCPGILNVERCAIQQWPASLNDFGQLHLRQVPLERLPEDLHCREVLRLADLPELRELPAGIRLDGELQVTNCPIEALPPGLRTGGDLTIDRISGLAGLPADLRAEGDLALTRLPGLCGLPTGVTVGGRLLVRDCERFALLPRHPKVQGAIWLAQLPGLRELPWGFSVAGELALKQLPGLAALPENLRVGSLHLEDLRIQALPAALQNAGSLHLEHLVSLSHWPETLNRVHGGLWLEFLPCLRALPENLAVAGRLTIRDCPSLTRLPRGLRAGSVECPETLAATADPPLEHWVPPASIEQRTQEQTAGDPLAQVAANPEIRKGLGTLALLALRPEFKIMGEFLEDGRYQWRLRDWSGQGHADRILGSAGSALAGFRCLDRDFLLAPDEFEGLLGATLRVLDQWGFGNRGGVFTYATEPEELEQGLKPYWEAAEHSLEDGVLRPYHVHLDFWRKDFQGGGMVVPFGGWEPCVPPPAFRFVPPIP